MDFVSHLACRDATRPDRLVEQHGPVLDAPPGHAADAGAHREHLIFPEQAEIRYGGSHVTGIDSRLRSIDIAQEHRELCLTQVGHFAILHASPQYIAYQIQYPQTHATSTTEALHDHVQHRITRVASRIPSQDPVQVRFEATAVR